MNLTNSIVSTPIGKLQIYATADAVTEILFEEKIRHNAASFESELAAHWIAETIGQLTAYFARDLQEFDLPLAPAGTEFQQRVWTELTKIPYGQTTSYGEIAKRIGSPNSSRAVGAANGQNPIPIIIPCHRVIGKNGSLTGFGGGLPIKEQLLELESSQRPLLQV